MLDSITNRLSLSEISGAFGDFGTLVPITIDMTKKNVLQPCVSFFWAGTLTTVIVRSAQALNSEKARKVLTLISGFGILILAFSLILSA